MIHPKYVHIFCLASLLALALVKPSGAQVVSPLLYEQHFSDDAEFIQAYNHIATLSQASDLEGLQEMADELQSKFDDQPENQKVYFALMDTITADMSSYNFGIKNINKKMVLARKYVLLVLQKPNVPLDVAVQMLPRIDYEDGWEYSQGKIAKDVWATQRTARVKLWVATWRQIDQVIDQHYDPHHVDAHFTELLNRVMMPSNETTIEQHQKDVQELAQLRRERVAQGLFRQLQSDFLPIAEKSIVDIYSKPPYNTEELKQYLKTYNFDEIEQSRILDQVEKSISLSQEPAIPVP